MSIIAGFYSGICDFSSFNLVSSVLYYLFNTIKWSHFQESTVLWEQLSLTRTGMTGIIFSQELEKFEVD